MGLTEKQKKRIESIFHDALKLAPEQREKFLANVCGDDDSVRQELTSLLQHYESASDLEELGKVSADPLEEAPLPERIGPYEVQSKLGRGGMGEVYLARDSRLGRKVAIKVLSAAIAGTPQAMERLRREALAASALNHPNILTVHEFGEAEGTQYIVTEYVEGQSLRELIGELSPESALGYAQQIGEALAAAHKAGIIHRDIKPENVMVRPDGYIKVLDFGLAKAAVLPGAGTTSIQQRLEQGAVTMPGMLVGTISYMSPEQVRGQEVDQRTDIWSWGVVLYEMLMGKRPFEGETASDVVAAILERNPEIPQSIHNLGSLFSDVLAKDVYSRTADMPGAMAELEASASEHQALHWPHGVHKLRLPLTVKVALATTLVVVLGSFAVLRLRRADRLGAPKIIRVTSTGNVLMSAISQDGDYIAYAQGDSASQSLRLRQISTGADTERLAASVERIVGITFSSGYIYYVRQDGSGKGKLYRMPLLAGPPRLVTDDVDSPVSFAPEGNRFVFLRNIERANSNSTALITRDIRGEKEQVITFSRPHEYFFSKPVWSGDGSLVAVGAFDDRNELKIVVVNAADGVQRDLPNRGWSWFTKLAWFDRETLLLLGGTNNDKRRHFMLLSVPDGKVRDVISDLADYADMDALPAQSMITAIQLDRISSIWIVPSAGKTPARKLDTAGTRFYFLTWNSSGKLISQSENAGRADLWSIDPCTGTAEPITEDGHFKMYPEASPDNRYMIYTSNKDGTYHLWRSDLSGGNAVRLTSSQSAEEEGAFTPDGKWVVFTMLTNGSRALWKVPIGGGTATLISNAQATKASVSPDGKLISCEYRDDKLGKVVVALLSFETGNAVRLFPDLPVETGARLRWAADGTGFFFVQTRSGVSNIWKQPLDGGSPVQMTHFGEDEIFYFTLSPDGQYFGCVRGRRVSDAVLIRLGE